MSWSAWMGSGVLVLAGAYAVGLYNRLVGLQHGVDKAWANIDVLLKQRHDELPKLVEVCQRYQRFEQATLEGVMAARNRVQNAREANDLPALGRAEGTLRQGLGQLFGVAEAYPELRSNEHFAQLQQRISQLENAIADRREFYNEAVNLHNVRLDLFPDKVLARWCGFAPRRLLSFPSTETADVNLKALFG